MLLTHNIKYLFFLVILNVAPIHTYIHTYICSHIHVYEFYVSCTVHCNIIMQNWFILHNYIQYKPISLYILYNYTTMHGAKKTYNSISPNRQIKYTNFVGLYCIIMHVYKSTYRSTSQTKLTVVKTMPLHNSTASLETSSTSGLCIQEGV
jgi:hypothetical protein